MTQPPTTRRSASSRPRIRDAEATRQRILEAAKKEFAQNGLEGARVDTIALEAQANKRMLYHYFTLKAKKICSRLLLNRPILISALRKPSSIWKNFRLKMR